MIKVCGMVEKEDHLALMTLAQDRGTSIGIILAHGVKLALKDLRNPRVKLPLDGRKSTAA